MHLDFGFHFVQVLWALSFAALLVLEVILLGKDRARRFPLFAISIALVTLRLLTSRLLYGRLDPLKMNFIFLGLAVAISTANLAVLVELARRSFTGASRKAWLICSAAFLVISGAVVAVWGLWPSWQTLAGHGTLSVLRFMQLYAQRADMLACMLAILLCLLVVFTGRRFGAGWRSHGLRLILGVAVYAAAQLAARGVWQYIATHVVPHSREEYENIVGLQEKIYNGSSVVYIVVLLWWIFALWQQDPNHPDPVVASAAPLDAALPAVEAPVVEAQPVLEAEVPPATEEDAEKL
ncbi:hypothetical protein ACOBR2_19385 [Telmatobacter bradus]|uniref:hypothetical protein n=1 Tax=Telmatobacter bradus TaxID=474953 RepID=UPI003B42BF83